MTVCHPAGAKLAFFWCPAHGHLFYKILSAIGIQVTKRCRAVLCAALKLIFVLKPARTEFDQLTTNAVVVICEEILKIINEEPLEKDVTAASLLDKALFSQQQRAEV